MSALGQPAQIERQVYEDPDVLRRFLEFLGGGTDEGASAVYITHTDGHRVRPDLIRNVDRLHELMEGHLDIDRSLLDRRSLLVHLDIEYVNFDSAAECYINPDRCFRLQEPVIAVIEEILLRHGIRPLHLLTGQGHHFVWRVASTSPVMNELTDLCPANCPKGSPVPDEHGDIASHEKMRCEAFQGLARVMEYMAHEIKRQAAPRCSLPVELTAVNVGPGSNATREMISVDISEYGDPLWTRVIRIPFSSYLKPWKNGVVEALKDNERLPPIFTIPMHEIDISKALEVRVSPEKTRELARRACVRIPEQSGGMASLIRAYRNSPLHAFHQQYDRSEPTTKIEIEALMQALPPCAREVLTWPNDLLLKPSGMRLLTRCLLGLGISARQIGQLIADIFSDGRHQWGCNWDIYSPEMRAHFYTRLFAGQIATGLDQAKDFNCVSSQEQGFCFGACGCSLEPWRQRLLQHQNPPRS